MRKLNEILPENQNNLSPDIQKKILRKRLLEERKNLFYKTTPQDWGPKQFFCALDFLKIRLKDLKKSPAERNFLISSYFPVRNELSLAMFADESWIFPAVSPPQELMWFYFDLNKKNYIRGKYGTQEKKREDCFFYTKNMPPLLCFVPGLAASREGYRLGYGGGYYDKFFSQMKHQVTSVLCLPSQDFLFDALPVENFDEKVDLIVW